jgi:alpha-glucosidase (family GH31 glycosyl hydrolase)
MQPIATETIFTPSSWDFLMGPDIFVAPIVESSQTRKVIFPSGIHVINVNHHVV